MIINVLKYWFGIFGLFGLVYTFCIYIRIKKMDQNIEKDEIKKIITWYGICFTIPFLLMQIFQLLGNYQTALYVFLLDTNNPFSILGFITIILTYALVFYLVIVKNGVEKLVKYDIFLKDASIAIIKVTFGILFIALLLLLLFGRKTIVEVFTYFEGLNILE